MRDSFIFKKEYALAFNGLDDSDRLKMYDALVAYAFSKCEELRYEISNGITLCASCHKGVHTNET